MQDAGSAAQLPFFAKRRPGWHLPQLNEQGLQLHSFEELEKAGRQACPKCGRSRCLYCYDCCIPLTSVPPIELPFQLHIVSAEQPSKATGTHAAALCPGQVQMHRLQQLPQLDASCTVVLFPSDDACTPDQLDLQRMQHVVIIDAPWRKAKEVNGFAAFDGMQRVKLPGNPRTCFWRYHTEGVTDEGVSTIEAIHLLMRALADRLPEEEHHWDNLLWYFAYQHKVVERAQEARAARRLLQPPQNPPRVQQKRKGKRQGREDAAGGQAGGGSRADGTPEPPPPQQQQQQQQQKEQQLQQQEQPPSSQQQRWQQQEQQEEEQQQEEQASDDQPAAAKRARVEAH